MLTKLKKSKKGFTLIELIIVIAILAILAAVIAPLLIGYIDDANQSTAKSNATTAYTAFMTAVAKVETLGDTPGAIKKAFAAIVGTGTANSTSFYTKVDENNVYSGLLKQTDLTVANANTVQAVVWAGTGSTYNGIFNILTGKAEAIKPTKP